MTGWIVGLLLSAAIAGVWWLSRRRAARNWERLEDALDALAEGRNPESLVFVDGGCFSRQTHRLEQLAALQDQLRQQASRGESNLETILASMEEGVMVVDAHHVLRRVNPTFLALHDLKADPRGQTVLRTLREPAVEEIVSAALKTGEAQTRDVEMAGTKPPRHFAVHAVPMRDDEGRPGVVAIFRDTSRLKQLEDVRREFVANVSHELRTPLSIFQGYLENLLDDPTMPRKEQAEIFTILRKHSSRLNALLEDLLILARLESRYDELQREAIAPAEFIRGVLSDWRERAEKKNLELTLDAPADLPTIHADPLRLGQVLNNLLENAIKYTDEGGRVIIHAARENGAVEVRIEDTGTGIPPTDLPHIFERFYRADKSRTRELGGTGLGLSIVKHIVQSHGGTVKAESTYGKGTTISFRLPLGEGG
jgi:two-component system phosphate regulon sensor histidine kinase PhoR